MKIVYPPSYRYTSSVYTHALGHVMYGLDVKFYGLPQSYCGDNLDGKLFSCFCKVVLKLNLKKSSTYGVIPASILKQSTEVHLKYLTNTINH